MRNANPIDCSRPGGCGSSSSEASDNKEEERRTTGARRGEYMTNQCKFGMGNYLFIPSAGDTCVSVMRGVKLSYLQNHRPQRKRTKYSTVSFNWEGRICPREMKANTEAINNRRDASASPVSCRQHERKVMYGKSGDLVVSMNMLRKVVE